MIFDFSHRSGDAASIFAKDQEEALQRLRRTHAYNLTDGSGWTLRRQRETFTRGKVRNRRK
jgi:hypothetical protein